MQLLTFATAMMIAIFAENTSADLCDVRQQVKYNLGPGDLENTQENGSIYIREFNYRNGTWKVVEIRTSLGCPCLNQKCIQLCSNLDNETSIKAKYTVDHQYVQIDINEMAVENLGKTCFAIYEKNQTIPFYKIVKIPNLSPAAITLIICCVVSITSLIILLATFAITGELKYFLGKSIFCHSITLVMNYAFSALLIYSIGESRIRAVMINSAACYILCYIIHYSFLCSFFWLNAISFAFFRTFCKTSLGPLKDKKKFWRYSLYAWISPLLMTIPMALIHLLYVFDDSLRSSVRERFGNTYYNEFFWGGLIFLHGPIILLLVLNWVFFIATLSSIYKKQREAGRTILRIGGRNTSTGSFKKNKFLMSTKLFVIMCGLRITDYVSFVLKDIDGIWFIFIAINSLGGLWLLICCVILSTRVRSRILKMFRVNAGTLKSTITIKSTRSIPAVSLRSRPQRF